MSDLSLELAFIDGAWQLQPDNKKHGGPLQIDLCDYFRSYQREQIGIKQDLAKAIGCKKDFRPKVLDATAGLLSDASLMAYLGCQVDALEQNPIVYTLITDAYLRAQQCQSALCQKHLQQLQILAQQNASDYLADTTEHYDTIYLDPMFPERQKSAKVKKGMQYLHQIAGLASFEEEARLLNQARLKATKRVVVKRPRLAEHLAEQRSDFQIIGKTVRYDVYSCEIKS